MITTELASTLFTTSWHELNTTHKALLPLIRQQTSFLPSNAVYRQRLWHIMHDTTQTPGCKTCGKPVSWHPEKHHYKTFCGNPRCPNIDADVLANKQRPDPSIAVAKRRKTNMQRYGASNYLASSEGKKHRPSPQSPEKIKATRAKAQQTMLERYGSTNISTLKLSTETLSNINNIEWLINEHVVNKRTLTDIAESECIRSGPTILCRRLRKAGVDTILRPVSTPEKEIRQWLIEKLPTDTEFVFNDRSIIAPHELDIVIPKYKIAIEFCGVFWHSEQSGKTRSYHKNKTDKCEQLGWQLITIFSDEWEQRQKQVKNKLLSLLGLDARDVVYARKCTTIVVDSSMRDAFMEQNHIQGPGTGSITYGLENNGDLVAVAVFTQRSPGCFELVRYATSKRVTGGLTKLMSHLRKYNTWTEIVSFADRRWSDGNLYEQTGWTLDKTIPPDYTYSPDGHKRIHKFNYRRKNLPDLLDQFDPELSEWENCKANGVLRVWDCGKKRYVQRAK